MIWIVRLFIVLAGLALLLVLAGQFGLFQGTAPTDLGVHEGRLKPPSLNPNSVSSQADLHLDHPQRAHARIAPLLVNGDGRKTVAQLREIVAAMPGARIVESRDDYLYAQFTTPLMRYVDDTEFWFDPAEKVIQVRSASRLGRSDLDLNRKRIEQVRAALARR